MLKWGKPFAVALGVQPIHTLGLIVCAVLFVGTTWKKTKSFFLSLPGFRYDVEIPFLSGPKGALVEKGSEEELEIPAEWLEGRTDIEEVAETEEEAPEPGSEKVTKKMLDTPRTVRLISKAPKRKLRVPGLLRFKQLCAVILLLVNVLMSQGALISGAQSRVMFWFFLFQAWICFEYLWKTRKKKVQPIET